MNKFFSYSGSKLKYVNLINSKMCNVVHDTYVEPFVGSGAMLFNLNTEFKNYIINDSDRNIIRIFKSFNVINYNEYTNELNFIRDNFGDISKNKEAFYNFRNWFNKTTWMSDTIKEGIYLQILANSVINSFLRFGPNGMNQSFGKRLYIIKENSFKHINHILKKTQILNHDYTKIMTENGFFFLDPPYMSQDSSYSGFTEKDLKHFILLLKGKTFLYTDILNEINACLEHKEMIRNMVCTAPSSDKSVSGNIEYIFGSHSLSLDW